MPDAFDDIPSPIDEARSKATPSTPPEGKADPFDEIPSPIDDARVKAGALASDPKQQFVGHGLAYVGQEALKGAVATSAVPSAIGSGFESYIRPFLPSYFSTPSTTPDDQAFGKKLEAANNPLPTPSEVGETINQMGLNNLTPQSTAEKYAGAGARGFGSAVVTLPLTGGAAVLPQLLAGVGGGIGSEVGHTIDPNSWWAPVAGGLIGGLGFGGATQSLSKMAEARAAQRAVDQSAANLARAKDALGSPVESFDMKNALQDEFDRAQAFHQSTVAEATAKLDDARDTAIAAAQGQINQSKANLDQTIATAKAGAITDKATSAAARDTAIAQVKAQGQQHLSDIADGMESVAKGHGASLDYDDAGTVLQSQARNFLTTELPKREAQAWAPVDEAIAPETPTPLENTLAAIDRLKARGGGLSAAVNLFSPNVAGRLSKALEPFTEGEPTAESVLGEGEAGVQPTPTWQNVRALRSSIGEAMSNPVVLKDIPRQQLETLYASTTADLRDIAASHNVEDQFDLANSTSKALRDFAEGPIAKIVDGPKPTGDPAFAPGKVASSLVGGGRTTGQTLQALRDEPSMASGIDELAAAHLRQASAKSSAWTLLSPNAREALVPSAANRNAVDTLIADKAAIPKSQAEAIAAIKADHAAGAQTPDTSAATAAHAATVQQAETTIAAAKAAHAEATAKVQSAAQDAIDNARFNRDSQLRALNRNALVAQEAHAKATDALATAKAAMKPSAHNAATYSLEGLIGGGVGEHLGEAAHHLLGLSGLDPGVGGLVGTMVPMGVRAIKNLLSSPTALRNSAIGATSGVSKPPVNPLGSP